MKQATVEAGAASWKAQPLALRQQYPQWIQSVYFTAELQTSDIRQWRLHLLSRRELGPAAAAASAELVYMAGAQLQTKAFALTLQQIDAPDAGRDYHRYTYQFGADAATFYQSYLQQRFAGEAKPLQLYYLQPLFNDTAVDVAAVIRVEYTLLPEYGGKTVGELMRLMFNLRERDCVEFCQSPRYLYDKSSACGDVRISEAVLSTDEVAPPH
ncbi:hypothetical protein [Rheinheimera texasensis]|uniref:hypothetical protein n=1 Tax=Rheinheimera texasensis TaxID=306205 RepID=UPI0032B18930